MPGFKLLKWKHIHRDVRAKITQAYPDASDVQFRATNLFYISCAAIFLLTLLLLLFVFEGSGYLEHRAKVVFGILFLFIITVFYGCIKLVYAGHLKLARFAVVSLAVGAVMLAITTTGGFPYSVASPAIMISVVMCYCLYGGRASLWTTIIMITALIFQWSLITHGFFHPPNFVSNASIEFNSVVALLATVAVTCSVLAIFDASNRVYIRKANASMESKTNFLANTSHEIRTPMNGIIGMSEVMMRTTDLDADQKMYMEAIHQSSTALMTIINDILDYSRLEAGHVEMQSDRFNLYALLHELRTLMTINAANNNVVIHLEYPKDAPQKFQGDAGRIRQVLINLIANAIKFTEDGSIIIRATITPQDETAEIRVSIQDDGIGIAEDKLHSIFERFTQAESGATQKYGGTGLGLSISQKLVELMGGHMGVKSVVGSGSTFWFDLTLPMVDAPQSNVTRINPVSGSQVLLFCDCPETIQAYGTALYQQGFRVFHTADKRQLHQWLATLDKDSIDSSLIALDQSMSPEQMSKYCLEIRAAQPGLKIMNFDPSNIQPDQFLNHLNNKTTAING